MIDFVELYALHVLIATLAQSLFLPILPKQLTAPYLNFGLALRSIISSSIESLYEPENVEVYFTSRVLGPFVSLLLLNKMIYDFILMNPQLYSLSFLGWIAYITIIVNSVPTLEEWHIILNQNNNGWTVIWIKLAVILDLFTTRYLAIMPDYMAFIGVFIPISGIISPLNGNPVTRLNDFIGT